MSTGLNLFIPDVRYYNRSSAFCFILFFSVWFQFRTNNIKKSTFPDVPDTKTGNSEREKYTFCNTSYHHTIECIYCYWQINIPFIVTVRAEGGRLGPVKVIQRRFDKGFLPYKRHNQHPFLIDSHVRPVKYLRSNNS